MKASTAALSLFAVLACSCSKTSTGSAPGATSSEYVDARLCNGCHAEIAKSYRQTGMGRSFYRATPGTLNVEDFAQNNRLDHKLSDRHYEMLRRDDRFFLQRSQTGFQGRETNVMEKEIHYVLGSGNHARSYLHRTPENRLVEMPVGWYAENGGVWAMSPGYDRADHFDFRRSIAYSCMFCHNGYPAVATGQDMPGADPIYPVQLPEGIDCQRCHGPGKQHVALAQRNPSKEKLRASIVNPARLSKERQLEVCMQCHLETTTSPLPNAIQRLDRGTFSFRAGQPLSDYILHFDHARGSGREDKFEIAGSAYRLRQSACFLKSNGALGCTTCHDPHRSPRGTAAVQQYAAACRSCHTNAHSPSPDCTSCHMPKQRTEDVVHVVVTDHKIQRRPAARLLAPLGEHHPVEGSDYQGEVALYYPLDLPPSPERDLYIATAQVTQKSNLKQGIPQLVQALAKHNPGAELYFELAQAYEKSGRRDEGIATYRRAVERNAIFVPALRSLGALLSQAGDSAAAIAMLERARAAAPRDAVVHNELGKAYRQSGRLQEALTEVREAVRLDPAFTAAQYTQGNLFQQMGDSAQAEQSYREAIRIQPDFAEAHNDLANLLTSRQDFAQAGYHFASAARLSPREPGIRYNYGVLLALESRFEEAQVQFEKAIAFSPAMVEAHASLGDLAARRRDWRRSARHFQNALLKRPDYGPALIGLGIAHGAMGDFPGARSYLHRAAGNPIQAVREEAAELLRSLDRLPPPSR